MGKELKVSGDYRDMIQDIICVSLVGKLINGVDSTIGSSFIVEIGEVNLGRNSKLKPEWLIHNFGCEWELRDKSNKKLMDWSEVNNLGLTDIVFSGGIITKASFEEDKFRLETNKYVLNFATIDDGEDIDEEDGYNDSILGIECASGWSLSICPNNDAILNITSEKYKNKGVVFYNPE